MSSPGGGGTKNKISLQTFKDLQFTPKGLFILAVVLSVLGLMGGLLGAITAESDGGKAAAAAVGGALCAGTGYWAYTIITDKKNLKTCNTSLWNVISTFKYAKPTRDPDATNINLCDAQKKAEYDNEDYKWFLTRPNATVSSNVDVWFFTDKAVSVSCPGDCTLYTANSTSTKRKSDAPTNTGCSGSGGGQRSPGAGGSSPAGGGGGTCSVGQKSKGTSPRCPGDSSSFCHEGQLGKCCTDTATGCAFADANTGTALSCQQKTFDSGVVEKRCCFPGTTYSQACATCTAGSNNTCCGDGGECNPGQVCKKPGGTAATSLTPGKCCAPNQVLDINNNCSAGADGTTCNTSENCATGKSCVTAGGTTNKKCCPTVSISGAITPFVWDSLDNKCIAPAGSRLRPTGDRCTVSTDCASVSGCDVTTGRCMPDCSGSTPLRSGVCARCVSGLINECCGISEQVCTGGRICNNQGVTSASGAGICCPSHQERNPSGQCENSTGRSNGTACYKNSNCSSGFCKDANAAGNAAGVCRPAGWECDSSTRDGTGCPAHMPNCSAFADKCSACFNDGTDGGCVGGKICGPWGDGSRDICA